MSDNPIFDELTRLAQDEANGRHHHKELHVGDFGDWCCHWCYANGDDHDSPYSIPCSRKPSRTRIQMDILYERESEFGRGQAAFNEWYAANEQSVLEEIDRRLENEDWN